MSPVRIVVDLDARRVTRLLTVVAAFWIAMHLILQAVHYYGGEVHHLILDRFDVDIEDSFPTWFSAVILFIAAMLVALIASGRRGKRFELAWWILALTFVALSADEIVGIHETLNTVMTLDWTYPGAALAVIFGIVYVPFLRQLDKRTRFWFILAGFVFVSGAVGLEQAETWFNPAARQSFTYAVWSAAEEAAEMGGVILFIYSLLSLLEREQSASVSRAGSA